MPELIEVGRRLIRALQASQFEVAAAFWLFLDDFERWRLMIASPLYLEGPRGAYSSIPESFFDPVDLPMTITVPDVVFLSPEDRRVKALEKRFLFKHEPSDALVEHADIGGEYIKAIYLYQLSET